MKKFPLIIVFAIISLLLFFCKEKQSVEPEPELFSFSGKVYTNINNSKVYLENVKVILEGDTTLSDSVGFFLFEDLANGTYSITFIYSSSNDSLKSKTIDIEILNENLYKEFAMYAKGLFKMSGRIYAIINNKKVYLENVKVVFETMNKTKFTDRDGSFFFDNIPSGKHHFTAIFIDPTTGSVQASTLHFEIFDQDISEEFLFYELTLYKVTGKVYSIMDNQKVYLENIKVIFRSDSVLTNIDGFFSFENVLSGEYSIKFLYSSLIDSQQTRIENIEVKNEDYFNEFFLYEDEKLNEDIIYVSEDNYYFRNKNGITYQITFTNDRIEDKVSFFEDGNRFVYLSVAGVNHYSINLISLNPMFHRVIYETDEQIQNLRISEEETKIYFIQYDKIMSLDINSRETKVLYNLPSARLSVLFNDCKRVSYHRIEKTSYGEQWNYIVTKNFISGDSTEFSTAEYYVTDLNISKNDELLYYRISFDGAPEGSLISTLTGNTIKNNITGEGMGNFSDDGSYFYGVEYNWQCYGDSECNWAKVYKLPSLEEIILESDLNYSIGFNSLSFSEKENKFIYSLNGDIKIYNMNTKRSYNFIASDADEHGARFVNQN